MTDKDQGKKNSQNLLNCDISLEGSSTANLHMAMKDNLVSLNRGGSDSNTKYLGQGGGHLGSSKNSDLDR